MTLKKQKGNFKEQVCEDMNLLQLLLQAAPLLLLQPKGEGLSRRV